MTPFQQASPRLYARLPLLRFGLAGLVNTGFGYAVFTLFVLADAQPAVALVGAAILGVAFNFQTSQRFVFRSRARGLRFVGVYIVLLLLNWLALMLLRRCGLPDIASQALLTLPIATLSFVGQRTFVFGVTGEQV